MKNRKKKNTLHEIIDVFRHEHPDNRSNQQWVKDMISAGWDWDRQTTGQSEFQRVVKKLKYE